MEIYLVRHTAVDNPLKLCYGQSDIELAADWALHFNALKQKLGADLPGSKFYSSPYLRCSKLAGFFSDNNFISDARLSEMNFGEWEQCPWSAIEQTVLNEWMADFVDYKVPGGESFTIMHRRCTEFWQELINQPDEKNVIITHAGVIRSLLAGILTIPLAEVFKLDIDYGSVTCIRINKQYGNHHTVKYINC